MSRSPPAPAPSSSRLSTPARSRAGGPGVADLPSIIQEALRLGLDDRLSGSFALPDVAPWTPVEFRFLGPNGATRAVRSAQPGDADQLTLELDKGAVPAITAPDPQPDPSVPRLQRHAYFVPVSEARVPFEESTVQVAHDQGRERRVDEPWP